MGLTSELQENTVHVNPANLQGICLTLSVPEHPKMEIQAEVDVIQRMSRVGGGTVS